MTKTKTRKFRSHAELDFGLGNKLELMFSSSLDRVTVRAVRDGIPQRPYSKSDIFADDRGAYFIINEEANGEVVGYSKIYLDNFKRIRGNK